MSEATTSAIPVDPPVEAVAPKLQPLGDLDAAACVGEFCEIPAHHAQAAATQPAGR